MARRRDEGWKHAKNSGHAREVHLASVLASNLEFSSALHKVLYQAPSFDLPSAITDGKSMRKLLTVLGDRNPAKTDIRVEWPTGNATNLSLKKSVGGQVWLVKPERFISGGDAVFGWASDSFEAALRLFIGPLRREEMDQLLRGRAPLGPRHRGTGVPLEMHQARFVAETIQRYRPSSLSDLVDWFRHYAVEVADLALRRGLLADPSGWADTLCYAVPAKENGGQAITRVFKIMDLLDGISSLPAERRATVGTKNGGTTLQLPFGFLQMHRPQGANSLQFHHKLGSVRQLHAGFSLPDARKMN